MENSEYIEYMEDDDKTKIKLEIENEYFEEDEQIKIEITEDKEYFEGLAKKAGVEGTELKIKKMKQGWYKREILLEKEDRY